MGASLFALAKSIYYMIIKKHRRHLNPHLQLIDTIFVMDHPIQKSLDASHQLTGSDIHEKSSRGANWP